jgi:hypothetical protein
MSCKLLAIPLLCVAASFVACGDKNKLSGDEISYVRLTAALMKVKSTAPPTADSLWLKPKLDSIMKSFHMDQNRYIAASSALKDDPEHTLIIYHAIKDTLGLK